MIYILCCVALFIQHAKGMRHIIFSSVAYLIPPYFPTLSHKRHDFREKSTLNVKCVLIFSTTINKNTRYFKRNSIVYYHKCTAHRSSCKVLVILVRFKWNLNFLDRYSKNVQMSNFMKICFVGTELFYTDRRTGWQTHGC
jgi:hypothetical protein